MRPKGAKRVGQKKLKPLAEGFPKALIQVVFLFAVIVKSAKMCQKAVWLAPNVGSYTQGRTAGDFLSSRKTA